MTRWESVAPQLKLIALDADDLAVISAHVQDARVQTADIIWRQGEKRLVVGMSRLDWEQTLAGETARSEEHTSELQSRLHLVCRLLLEKKKNRHRPSTAPR